MPPYLTTPLGTLFRDDAPAWLRSVPAESASLIVADPPYNLGKAAWDDFPSQAAWVEWNVAWVREARRVLAPDGTLYLCGFPEPMTRIAAAIAPLFASFRSLVWYYRNKASMTDDWGRSHETILHMRAGRSMRFDTDAVRIPYNQHTTRYPERTQAATSTFARGRAPSADRWRPHPAGARPRDVIEIPTLCNGSAEKTEHPTQKPLELIRRLVLASSQPGDLVLDPFGGSGTTYVVCEQENRRWLGCEREESYCALIARRLQAPAAFRPRSADESPQKRAVRRSRLRGPSS